MAQNARNQVVPYIGVGLGSAAVVKYGDFDIALSEMVLLAIILIMAITLIIIIYRVTSKVDIIALINAWRGKLDKSKKVEPSQEDEGDEEKKEKLNGEEE